MRKIGRLATEPKLNLIKPPNNAKAENILSWLTLLAVYAVLASRFDLRLLFQDTILTGGDSASWFQVLKTLREDFLPRGRLFGFSQANFFGYLEGQHYFILPFLAAALLGFLVPLSVALKLATVAGVFALPLTMFLAASSIRGKRRAGALASVLSLLFLFNESYSIFGGNWLSTLAGEFCFSWAIAFLPLLVASVSKDWREKRSGIASGILLALTGLCHFFVFMPAFFLPFFPAFKLILGLFARKAGNGRPKSKPPKEALIVYRMLSTYVIALLILSFWLLPMILTRRWAQPISLLWHFSSPKDFASQTLAWVWGPAALLFAFLAFYRRRPPLERRLFMFLFYALACCAFLFFIAPGLGMPDIRFVPTALLFCALGLSLALDSVVEWLGRKGRRRERLKNNSAVKNSSSLISNCAMLLLTVSGIAIGNTLPHNAPSWFLWNYSGYEVKSEWPAMKELMERYQGTFNDGRFLWEKQDQRDNRDFGSERAFENLYLFTGFPSSEGIHYGSSMMARAATYLQSSYSPNPVDPEAERIYSKIDPESWRARFLLLNARYIITHSEQIRDLFENHPDFRLDYTTGKFSVFEFKGHRASYVSVLPESALNVIEAGAGGFRTDYYRFFREYELYELPFVSSEFADKELYAQRADSSQSWPSYEGYRNLSLAKRALMEEGEARGDDASSSPDSQTPNPPFITAEHVDNFNITFSTRAPGKAHYIRISYAPGWKSLAGEKLYPIAPGFMLIFPSKEKVVLEYRRTAAEIIGIVLSLLSIPLCLFFWKKRPGRGFPWKILLAAAFALFLGATIALMLQTAGGYPALSRDIGKARLMNAGDPIQRKALLSLVEPWADTEMLERFDNRLVFDAFRLKALALLSSDEEEAISKARGLLETLKSTYPHTRVLDTLPSLP